MNKLRFVWERWKKFAHVLGNFQGQVFLTLFYFLILFPMGIFFRFFSDPLAIKTKTKKSTTLQKWNHITATLEEAKLPY